MAPTDPRFLETRKDGLERIVRLVSAEFNEYVDEWCPYGESPIEQLFLLGLGIAMWETDTIKDFGGALLINPQAQIGKYRVDLLLVRTQRQGRYDVPVRRVVVEVDGHEFHERTKEQAARDKKRDRTLQGKDYIVLRYTGSEVYHDPAKCAEDALAHVYGWPV